MVKLNKKVGLIMGSLAMFATMTTSCSNGNSNAATAESSDAPITSFKIDTIADGLDRPWSLALLPDGKILVTERSGQLRVIADGKLQETPIKGVPKVYYEGQGGLLEVATHPNYTSNKYVYLSFSSEAGAGEKGKGANTALLRAKFENNELVEPTVIYKASPNVEAKVHYGGKIIFDNEGKLFLTLGERGEKVKAQDLGAALGKVVRLNDDGTVPQDNPFVSTAGALPEIYSYGHRNPQGLVYDATTNTIWEHEHGPQGGDELNVVQKGKNYGWPEITYGINYDNTVISKDSVREGMEQPATFWKPSIAPSGMTLVKGTKFKNWKGNLLVGSMKFTYIERVVLNGTTVESKEKLFEGIGRVRDIRESADGDIYVVIESGQVLRITPGV
jgi:glucose/arabinose dehydrogenase